MLTTAYTANSDQINTDGDTEGDACDSDDDNDGCLDSEDDYPLIFSEDSDLDGNANDCDICDLDPDDDIDGDGVAEILIIARTQQIHFK